jgi:uncharacterized protein YndB with AHSA1/START domain
MTEAASEPVTARDITITRVFNAPRELVWKAWTEPERLATWWGKRGWNAVPSSITMDVRPGGAFRVTTVSEEDGAEMASEGAYREVIPPERLVFAEVPRENCHEGAVGTVTLTELRDGTTEMVFQTTIWASGELADSAAGGLESAFDRLAETLT